jgi:hypothetical protein
MHFPGWAEPFALESVRAVEFGSMDEEWLAARVSECEAEGWANRDIYWLSLARIAELALFCAGGHADAGRLREVGDLMFNPRKILVHIRGEARPVVKERHTAMTEQFGNRAGAEGVIPWLVRNTINEIREKPIIPALMETLESCGRIANHYLEGIQAKARRIADTACLVSSSLSGPWASFEEFLGRVDEQNRRTIESGLCRFDLACFRELGNEIDAVALYPDYQSPFLKPSRES